MHKYLRAVGFSDPMNAMDRLNLIDDIKKKASYRESAASLEEENEMLSEYRLELGGGLGLSMTGVFEEENDFLAGEIEPYLMPETLTSMEEVFVEQKIDNRSFAGICDDLRIGTTLIFRLLNPVEYLRFGFLEDLPCPGTSVCLSALSIEGTVVLPLEKTPFEQQVIERRAERRRRMMEEAMDGDEQAMQKITTEDMDTYSDLLDKIADNDILSLVDSFFMPTGAECDIYYILGEILSCRQVRNPYTLDRIHILSIRCSGIDFTVGINDRDLYGHPEPGRRFKGVIWLQGIIQFPGASA
ncbi:MAG: DUF3881 family protein [Eubacteriales bacterium]|nr:DUF3881 family protein [Eubacteriales bacterium]